MQQFAAHLAGWIAPPPRRIPGGRGCRAERGLVARLPHAYATRELMTFRPAASLDTDVRLLVCVLGRPVDGRQWDLDGTSSAVRGAECRIFSPSGCNLPRSRFSAFAGIAYSRLVSPKADDGPRTRDLWLGKPTLYQLSYVRVRPSADSSAAGMGSI